MKGRWDRILVGSMMLVLVLGGCSAGTATRAEDRDRGFLLTIATPRQVWAADESIEISAGLSYLGPGARRVWGPGPGPHIGFDVVELTGHRKMESAWLQACRSWLMTREGIKVPFHKSGGWTAEDPNAAWYEEFMADPEFRLPAGRWQVTAVAPFAVGRPDACGGDSVDLRASLTLLVQ